METLPSLPREAVLVVNAHSRRGEELFREAKERLEAAGMKLLAAHAVRDPAQLEPKVREAVDSGAPMLILGGGDGTVSYAVDYLIGRPCVLALLPLGTANSFARTLGLPLDLDGAIETIAGGARRRIDLGAINGDYFANSAAIGLSPLIGEGIPRSLKRWLGRLGYLLWAFWCLSRFRPFRLTVDDGGGRRSMWASEARILNGRFHAGVELAEEAALDSGEIIVQAVRGRRRRRLLWDWFAHFWKLPGRDEADEEFRGARIEIETEPQMRISIDGEVVAETPALVEAAHGAIEVAAPAEVAEVAEVAAP
ncbi:MAG: diacylglycerol/lipid kinase family protein [Sphingomonadaceae bacterium]